jgi:hypothetical protein
MRNLHQAEATVRVVDESRDEALTSRDVDKAFNRLEATSLEENKIVEESLLIGLLPYAQRFELKRANGKLISGKVSPSLSEIYLEKLLEEQAINKWWRATLLRREITRFGKSTERFDLLDLEEIEQPNTESKSEAGSADDGDAQGLKQ